MIIENKDYSYKFDAKKCETCEGNCCIGESGYIWITKEEIATLANYLNQDTQYVLDKYIEKVGYKFSIREDKLSENNYRCVFFDLDKKQCGVYEARPTQCRTFPFWDYYKNRIEEVKEECPAILD